MTEPRNYFREIAEATARGDLAAVSALAMELASKAHALDEQRARRADAKRREREGRAQLALEVLGDGDDVARQDATSRDVARQGATGSDTPSPSSLPPDPQPNTHTPASASPRARVREGLPDEASRTALDALLDVVPEPETWALEMAAAVAGMPGHPHLTATQLGEAVREYVADGKATADAKLRPFRRYMALIAAQGEGGARPPPGAAGGATGGRRGRAERPAPQRFEYTPTETDEDVRWTT